MDYEKARRGLDLLLEGIGAPSIDSLLKEQLGAMADVPESYRDEFMDKINHDVVQNVGTIFGTVLDQYDKVLRSVSKGKDD
jgi:hypothetical protein